MNKPQRIVLRIAAAVVALMVLFPPYALEVGAAKIVRERGYGFIADLPIANFGEGGKYPAKVDIEKLAAQIAGVLIVGGLVFLSLKDGPGKPS
jgi:hypothetical protein